jgi:hypothetical protein
MSEPHRCAEAESVALPGFEGERDETAGVEGHRGRGERWLKVADIDQRVGGEDKIESRPRLVLQKRGRVADLERVIEAALARFGDHAGRQVDAGQMIDAAAHCLPHEARAAADVEGVREPAAGSGRIQRVGDEGGGAIGEAAGQMRVEPWRIIVEQPRDIGLRQDARRFASPSERKPRGRSLGVGRVGCQRRTECIGGAIGGAELFARFAEREPRRRPVGGALQRLLEYFRRRAPVAVVGGGLGVRKTAFGDEIAAGEGIVRHG